MEKLGALARYLADEAATTRLGADLARALRPGMTVWLSGDLGAGKTTLVRGLLREFNFAGRVKSPTFTLVESYPMPGFNVYHFDLYRFTDPEEWEDVGFRDYFNDQSICLVEWPERGEGVLPPPDLKLCLEIADEGRMAQITSHTENGRQCIARIAP